MGVANDDKLSSYNWWWFNRNKNCIQNRSPWLQSTLAELDVKTEAMLKIIEENADTFAQKAEFYFKKRPQLINMIEGIYRAHRLLAEEYDQMFKCTSRPHMLPFTKCTEEKSYDSYSETFDLESETDQSCNRSEIDDSVNDKEEIQVQVEKTKLEVPNGIDSETKEVLNLREEIERLQEERRVQQELLMQKDEEKREAIRQLCIGLDLLREENSRLRMDNIAKASKKRFWRRLFDRSPK